MRANVKKSFTHYYVQALEEGKQPMLVVHSEDKEKIKKFHQIVKNS
jgi:ribosomal protein L18